MDTPADVRWLTYREAAALLGTDEESVQRRARRRRWARTQGNDGRVRVAVPLDVIPDRPPDTPPDSPPDIAVSSANLASALQSELATLREMLEHERDRGKRAEIRAEFFARELGEVRERLGRAEGEAEALRAQGLTLGEQIKAERHRSQALEAQRDAARAELEAWERGGPFARAWRAFISRRGRG